MTDGLMDEAVRAPRPFRTALIVALVAFVAGAALVAWALTRWEPARKLILPTPAPIVQVQMPAATAQRALTTPDAIDAAAAAVAESRVAGLETRIARIDEQASAAAGNAARAESLLIAFAARRAVDRGAALGYIEGQLRDRFGETQPRAVAAIIAAGQAPATIDSLRQGLVTVTPRLAGANANEDWWATTRHALGSLFVVRRADSPSPTPDERLTRARLQIEGGQVDAALTEVSRLPGRDKAATWMASARRYVEAHRALDILEAAALTAPKARSAPQAPVSASTPLPPPPSAAPAATAGNSM